MNRKTIRVLAIIVAYIGGSISLGIILRPAHRAQEDQLDPPAMAAHDGCMNAIGKPAVGYAEMKVEGDVLKCWIERPDGKMEKDAGVPNKEIPLAVKLDDGEGKQLTLEGIASSSARGGEFCYFEARAQWLAGTKKFQADGTIDFEGKPCKIHVSYPGGYCPVCGNETGACKHTR